MLKKRIIVFVALAMIAVQAVAQTRTVTVDVHGVTVKEFFGIVEKQTGFSFAYNNSEIDLGGTVSVKAEDEDVISVLNRAVAPFGLMAKEEGRQLFILRKPGAEAPLPYSGVVTDRNSEPLIGASVIVEETGTGTITDTDGRFSIDAVSGNTVKVSYLGFIDKVFTLGEDREVAVTLEEDATVLEDAVVIGYGTASKRLVSSSIASVRMSDIERGAETDPVKMLQGRVTGVSVVNSSGTPGTDPNIIVRGVSSISGSSSPLYVVDGIPAEKYPAINAADIESLEVLKDASATAIYGSRANAGVIIITTKSGKAGKTSIDVNAQMGVSQVAHDVPMANTSEYIRTIRDAIDNYNVQMMAARTMYIPDNPADFDWVGAISRRLAVTSSSNVSLSGGTEKINFYVSAGVDTQEGYINSTSYNKYTGRAKFGYKAFKWLKFNLNSSIAYSRQNKAEETSTSLKVLRTAREEQPWYAPRTTLCRRSMPPRPTPTPQTLLWSSICRLCAAKRSNSPTRPSRPGTRTS